MWPDRVSNPGPLTYELGADCATWPGEIVRISCISSALSCSLHSLRTHKRVARSWFVCCWIAAGGLDFMENAWAASGNLAIVKRDCYLYTSCF